MTLAVVAMGSNLPPRRSTLQRALADLGRIPGTRLVRASRFRETAPIDAPAGSHDFLNGACLLETTCTAQQLLQELLAIETRHGRVRGAANGPRTLDLDLIVHGDVVLDEPGITVPHPRAHERPFVLEPAAEVAPDMRHPLLKATLNDLHQRLAVQQPG